MIQLQIVDIDNPPRSLGTLTDNQKKQAIKSLEESIKKSKQNEQKNIHG